MFYIIFGIYFVFVRLQAYLSKRMDQIANYVNTATDAAHLFADYTRHKRVMILTMIALLLCVIIGGVILTYLEDWTLIQGIYFAVETSSVSSIYILPTYSLNPCTIYPTNSIDSRLWRFKNNQ